MSAPSTLLARWPTRAPVALRKSADTRRLTFQSVLTFPVVDLAGDYVEPAGLDFTSHKLDPSVDLEHARDPHVKGYPVAWARESLSKPGAPYAVANVRLNVADDGQPEDWHVLPVGTEYYDKSCRIGMQVFALREQDVLPASSLEFRPVPGFYKALGKSPLEPRSAFHFLKADVVRWTVCAQGVNPGALTLSKSKSAQPPYLVPHDSPIIRVITDRRVNVGGRWEQLAPVLLKALAPLVPHTKPNTVRVEKAMDETATLDDTTPMVEDETMPEDTGGPAKPTVQAHYDTAQGLLDLVDQAEQQLDGSEHVKGKAFLMKKLELIRGLAEDIKGMGDKIDDELSGDEPDGDEDETGAEPEAPDMATDDDGMLKAVRPVYKKALKRFSTADVQKAQEPTAAEAKAMRDEIKTLQRKLRYYS